MYYGSECSCGRILLYDNIDDAKYLTQVCTHCMFDKDLCSTLLQHRPKPIKTIENMKYKKTPQAEITAQLEMLEGLKKLASISEEQEFEALQTLESLYGTNVFDQFLSERWDFLYTKFNLKN